MLDVIFETVWLFVCVAAIHKESLYESFVDSVCKLFNVSDSEVNDIALLSRYYSLAFLLW